MGEFIGLVPPKEGFIQNERFNFARFAQGPNYRLVNRNLVEKVFSLLPGQEIVALDVAMGHGMVSRLVAELMAGTGRQVEMIGVDLDAYAVKQARTQIIDTEEVGFTFLQGDATDLKKVLNSQYLLEGPEGNFDYTSIHDAIHEIRDDPTKAEILESQEEMLKPGGLLSYNSAFTSEATGMEWGIWLLNFLKISGAKRDKSIQGMPVHTPKFYYDLIEAAGLEVIHEDLVTVQMSKEELMGISEYPPFVRGFTESLIFPRPVGLEEGVKLMQEAIQPTLDKLKKDSLPRRWHEIIAQKP